MGHAITAFVGQKQAITRLSALLDNAPCVPSKDPGFVFLPVSDDAFDIATRIKGNSDPVAQDYHCFSRALADLARECSTDGAIAHVFTDYFGGNGKQGASAWKDGAQIFAPEVGRSGPINSALAAIGFRAAAPLDAFDAIGLGEVRSNEDFERFTTSVSATTDQKPSTWIRWLRDRIFPSP